MTYPTGAAVAFRSGERSRYTPQTARSISFVFGTPPKRPNTMLNPARYALWCRLKHKR